MECFILNNNESIPVIGFGPGGLGYNPRPRKKTLVEKAYIKGMHILQLHSFEERKYIKSVAEAIKLGFRLIDFSESYGDGSLLREAIIKSGVPREQLFITTRISNRSQSNHTIREDFVKQLKGLGTDYVDLLQFHWPVPGLYLDTWSEMETFQQEGLCRMLGIANCNQHHLQEILSICKIRPVVGQFEIHPLFTQKELIRYYKSQGIQVEAYTSLARHDDRLFSLPLLKKIGTKYHKTIAQVILRWDIQNECIPIVRSFNRQHIHELLDVFDFELTKDEMRQIDAININSRLRYDPDNCDFSVL